MVVVLVWELIRVFDLWILFIYDIIVFRVFLCFVIWRYIDENVVIEDFFFFFM